MSEMREDSFYEISLTHKQILSVFVVLLGCVVVAFLTGVWVGQREGQGPGPEVVVAGGAPEEAAPETSDLERLNFFDDDKQIAEDSPQPAVEPGAGTTLADDLAASPEPSGGDRQPAAEPSRPAAPQRAAIDDAPPPETEPETEVAAAATPEPGDGIVIQVFSSQDRDQAERIVADLKGGGHPAYLSPVDVDGQTMFRVRIGPYAQRAQAESVAENVRRSFRLDTWITQNS